jgi:hypothetical protein
MIREPILGLIMRSSISAFCLVIWATSVTAQTKSEDKKLGDSPYSTGRTVLPDNKGQLRPRGWTGPLSTGPENASGKSTARHAVAHAACARRLVQVHCRSLASRALKASHPRGPLIDTELPRYTGTDGEGVAQVEADQF